MILKQIKRNGVEVMVAIAVVAAGMAASMFLGGPARHIEAPLNGSPLFNDIYSHLFGGHISIGTQVVSLLLLCLEVMMIVLLNSDFEFTRAKPSAFALVCVPLALSWVPCNTLLPEQVANILIALGLIKAFACHGLDDATFTFFDAGLFFGGAALLCLPAAMMTPVGLAALMIFRSFKGREYIAFLLGCAAPHLFYAAIYYLAEGSLAGIADFVSERLSQAGGPALGPAGLCVIGVQGFFVIAASALMLREYPKLNLIGSQAYRLFFFMFICMAGMCFTPFFGVQVLRLSLMPLAMMLVTVFHEIKDSLWADILAAVFVLCFAGAQALWYID